jgi:hypothetical protein
LFSAASYRSASTGEAKDPADTGLTFFGYEGGFAEPGNPSPKFIAASGDPTAKR